MPNKIPSSMSSKLLDYEKPGKKTRVVSPSIQADLWRVGGEAQTSTQMVPVPVETEIRSYKGPLDYPTISAWLKICEEDFERGRDKHEYSMLAPMFEANGCTRIDDVTRMSTGLMKSLAAEVGLSVTIGLINRVHQYATEDVARVKSAGRLII